ncbi:cold shock domain-containing protein [Kitasatospora acidiphila]|uniref:Cold shock domain-containing protein n=1 Tax=Kitasatospora acidiphila TaxID=2567942 RepID=A0A540WFR2_9ACTN|nr:cold shock domain-containing protein [Kitasatospora acidiphila]
MVAGRVVRFDSSRGYGFIAPEGGGEDVFLHVNDMEIPESYVRSGLAVDFEVEEGDRGLKASAVRLALGPDGEPVTPPNTLVQRGVRSSAEEDSVCDALAVEEYTAEVTEVLLAAAPSLTGEQILLIRQGLLQSAKVHGWITG